MLMFKDSVPVFGLHPEILAAVDTATDCFADIGKDCIVTSARSGRHMRKSKHYSGMAVDLRSRHLTQDEISAMTLTLREALGIHYDVLFETNHFHVEFDPDTL